MLLTGTRWCCEDFFLFVRQYTVMPITMTIAATMRAAATLRTVKGIRINFKKFGGESVEDST